MMTRIFNSTTLSKALLVLCLTAASNTFASISIGVKPRNNGNSASSMAVPCVRPTAKIDLDINNVRTTILNGGDFWWDRNSNAKYEIPKGSKRHSLYAGSIWVGGTDAGGNLKVAAQTYHQTGDDFWSGPLDSTQQTNNLLCKEFDRIWSVKKNEVEAAAKGDPSAITADYREWPTVNKYESVAKPGLRALAPFEDLNQNGVYEFENGEYPKFNIRNRTLDKATTKQYLLGDQAMWWVVNDKGNIHTETGSQYQIGLEIHNQAFAYERPSTDPLSNMTFYRFKIINKSSESVQNTYFGVWADSDLGNPADDYVGCDVKRGLGYTYNGDDLDEDGQGLGYSSLDPKSPPPALGIDFFEGPKADTLDGIDNDHNGVVDDSAKVELITMTKFVFYDNDGTVTGNPSLAQDYYNYLRGIWRDGEHMVYGGNGYPGSPGATTTECDYMFPGDSDPEGYGTNHQTLPAWTEESAGNVKGDRRMIQSAGAFTLTPGAINYITVGVVWTRANSGKPFTSVQQLRAVDDGAQALFDNNFKVLQGPDSPDLTIRALDKKLVLTLSYIDTTSNNYREKYEERNPNLPLTEKDSMYHFQGYMIMQLKDNSLTGLYDNESHTLRPEKAVVVAQCDKIDTIGQLVNYERDPVSYNDWRAYSTVYEAPEPNGYFNKGIKKTFVITRDAFTSSELVNHKSYYFTAVAYAYGDYEGYVVTPYNSQINPGITKLSRYVTGAKNNKIYTASPHLPDAENGGQVLNADYGDGVEITRISGSGNGGNVLKLSHKSAEEIVNSSDAFAQNIVYQQGYGPVRVKIVDPVRIPKGDFTFTYDQAFTPDSATRRNSFWSLSFRDTKGVVETIKADKKFSEDDEQYIDKWGMSIITRYAPAEPTQKNSLDNGALVEPEIEWEDSTKKWLTGVVDADNITPLGPVQGRDFAIDVSNNGLVSFAASVSPQSGIAYYNWINSDKLKETDKALKYQQYFGGTWAPMAMLTAIGNPTQKSAYPMPGITPTPKDRSTFMINLPSVMFVITPDKNMWTRSNVVETYHIPDSVNGVDKFKLKLNPSVGKDGQPDGSGTNGMSWFPGYAINMETGERLNIIFGEASKFVADNGNDMMWNPTSTKIVPTADGLGELVFGGRHFIYVTSTRYDQGVSFNTRLTTDNFKNLIKDITWVTMPLAAPGVKFNKDFTPLTKITYYLPVSKPYRTASSSTDQTNNPPVYGFSTMKLAPEVNSVAAAKSALDLINVVPNPYYALSAYERDQFDSKVKITNLPSECKISIYSPNGSLVRIINFTKKGNSVNKIKGYDKPDDTSLGISSDKADATRINDNAVDWDLKNSQNIPVGSGIYLIHIDAPGIGERVIKWFGTMRPLDVGNY